MKQWGMKQKLPPLEERRQMKTRTAVQNMRIRFYWAVNLRFMTGPSRKGMKNNVIHFYTFVLL